MGLDDQLNSDTTAEEASLFIQGPWSAAQLLAGRRYYQEYADQKPLADRVSTRLMLFKPVAETAGVRQATDPRDLIYSVLGLVVGWILGYHSALTQPLQLGRGGEPTPLPVPIYTTL
jgi:hypothetical protein